MEQSKIIDTLETYQNSTMIFYGPEGRQWALVAPGGASRGAQPTRVRQKAQACALGGCAHLGCPPNHLFAL